MLFIPGMVTVDTAALLRAALSAAEANASLHFFIPEHSTLHLGGSAMHVHQGVHLSLVSIGNGATLSGIGASRLFHVCDGGQLEISLVHLHGGSVHDEHGAAIRISGEESWASLNNLLISACSASGSGCGGAIACVQRSTVRCVNITISDCSSGSKGGGLYATVCNSNSPLLSVTLLESRNNSLSLLFRKS